MKKLALVLCVVVASVAFAQQNITREQAEQIARAKVAVEPLRLSAGFELVVYTPTTWTRYEAEKARVQNQHFFADVSMLAPIIRVFASPNLETSINSLCESAKRVVLKDETKQTVLHSIHEEPFTQSSYNPTISNDLDAPRMSCSGVIAHFTIEQLNQVHGGDGDREFYITVVGDSNEQDFKVTRKDFEHLP